MKHKLEKIEQTAMVATPNGRKMFHIGDIYECVDEVDYINKITWEKHHWKDLTPKPEPVAKPKAAPKKKGKKGAK